jgi:hypothetical protein
MPGNACRPILLEGCALLALAGFLTSSVPAFAKDCGDDLGGQRVACGCGDTVVSDTVLRPEDPVVRGRCPEDGLVVRARGLAETIRLDLAGLSIVGSGVGDGIAVVAGGSDGAVLTGGSAERRGEIVGFGTGVNVRTARAARRIESLEVEGQRHEGLLLRSAGTFVTGVRAIRNGGDGVRVSGEGGRLFDIEAIENKGAGVRVISSYTMVAARAERNREHGIVVRGAHVTLDGSSATNNTGYGVLVGGRHCDTDDVVTAGNSRGNFTSGDRRQIR